MSRLVHILAAARCCQGSERSATRESVNTGYSVASNFGEKESWRSGE